MRDALWGLASLVVAGSALTVIAVPTIVGIRRGVRAIVSRASRRHEEQSTSAQEPRVGTVTAHASPAAVAAAVTSSPQTGACRVRHLGAMSPQEHARLAAGLLQTPQTPQTLPALSELECAMLRVNERRGVPARILAEWQAGPLLQPGVYPLLESDALLSRRTLAALLAAHGCPGWERSALTGGGPLHPTSDAWN